MRLRLPQKARQTRALQEQSSFKLILADPIGFLGNLLTALAQGFGRFVDNIETHLKKGFLTWLFGELGDTGIAIPTELSLGSILKLVLAVLGLTWERAKAEAVKMIGPTGVGIIQKLVEYIEALWKAGPAALWEKVKEDLGNLKTMVIDAIQDWLITTLIKKAVAKIVSMFNPVGAIVQAIMMIYDVVMFVIERAKQILAFVEAVVDSIAALAKGDTSAAAAKIEGALGKLVPVLIGLLASIIGLGGIGAKIKETINKVQNMVWDAIRKLIKKGIEYVKKMWGKLTRKPDERTPEQKQADLHTAMSDAEAIRARPEISETQIKAALPAVITKYKMTSLELVVDIKDGTREAVHFEGEINPKEKTSKAFIKSSADKVITEISIQRIQFDKKIDERVNPNNIPLLKNKLDRCHVISSDDMLKHYKGTLEGKKWSEAKELLDPKEPVAEPLSDANILKAAKALYKKFFDDVNSLFLGESSKNREPGVRLDPRHPDYKNADELEAHIKKMADKYALTEKFKPTR